MYTLKKSLGQHFLKDEHVCRKIVTALKENPFTKLLEVGPGGGALTKYLLELPAVEFKAVELDEEKVQYLLMTYPQLEGRIIHQSFLDIAKPFEGSFTIVGNFPYNISTEIVFRSGLESQIFSGLVLMFQKEVAQRIAAPEGSKVYGVTSVLVQAFFNVQYLFEVKEGAFQPPPKVKSAQIRFIPRSKAVNMRSEKDFNLLVKTAFNQRRKTLRNALKGLFDPDVLSREIFGKRAEQLSVDAFGELSFEMK